MRIVAITDKKGSAIDRLAHMNAKLLPHLRYEVYPVHPKRPSEQELAVALEAIRNADLVDVQYWKSGVMLRTKFPDVFEGKPVVLTHHNEHNIIDTTKDHWPWKDMNWDAHVCKNGWQLAELKKQGVDAKLIRHAIDWDLFSYVQDLTEEKVVGYVGQVKKVKGVKFIAQACKELGYKLLLTGSVSESAYWDELNNEYDDTLIWALPGGLGVSDEMIGGIYQKMRVYCANSDDGTESGTMPILEAMASGIPVVTRNFGLVRDCGEHQKNMWVRNGRYDDVEDLKKGLQMVMENQDIADSLREAAWRTVRQYHPEIQAREYDRLFRKTIFPKQPSVSVIMPTAGRNDQVAKNIAYVTEQGYKNIELVICDDNNATESMELMEAIKKIRTMTPLTIRYVWTGKMDGQAAYGLAKARNLGIIEATGDILVFCDDRLQMHRDAVGAFVNGLLQDSNGKPTKRWLWGSKGTFKTFVENFSAAWRRSIIDGGMFCERMDRYGGMTQETSNRFSAQGFRFDFCAQALAEPAFGTHSKSHNRENIVDSKIRLFKMGFQ